MNRNERVKEFLIKKLDEMGSYAHIASKFEGANATWMSNVVNGHINVGEKAARRYEAIFGLDDFYFDEYKGDPFGGTNKWHIPVLDGVYGDSEKRLIHGRTLEPLFTNGDVIYIRKDISYDDLPDGAIVALNNGTYATKTILPDGSFNPAPEYYGVVAHRIVTFLYK